MTEKEFLEGYDANNYDRPSVAVDVLVFKIGKLGELDVLLSLRDNQPCKDKWALFGSFVKPEESLEDTAKRVLKEKAGIEELQIEQLYTFGGLDRDPRTRVISVAYFALVSQDIKLSENSVWFETELEGEDLKLFPAVEGDKVTLLSGLRDYFFKGSFELKQVDLAFDHKDIIKLAINRLRGKLDYTDIGFNLLKDKNSFTAFDLQKVFEAIKGEKLDKPNFRRWFFNTYLKSGKVIENGKNSKNVQTYKYIGGRANG